MASSIPEWFYEDYESNNIWQPTLDYELIDTEIDELQRMVAGGAGETEIQTYLKARPYLFDGLYRHGHGTFLFPEKKLGCYQADWLAASGDSGGLSWDLIELECPQKIPFIAKGHFADSARKGINQISEWRQWISDNHQHVMSPKSQGGLGLHGLRTNSRGIVVVGNRNSYQNSPGKDTYYRNKQDLRSNSFIDLISYDTLFERMKFRVHNPPPNYIHIIGHNEGGKPTVARGIKRRKYSDDA